MNNIDMFNPNAYSPIKNFSENFFNNDLNSTENSLSNDSIKAFEKVLNGAMEKINGTTENLNPLKTNGIDTFSVDFIQGAEKPENGGIQGFAENIKSSLSAGINSINDQQLRAQKAAETFAAGGDISVHEVMVETEKANLSMQMATQVRNKLLTAYTELYKMQL